MRFVRKKICLTFAAFFGFAQQESPVRTPRDLAGGQRLRLFAWSPRANLGPIYSSASRLDGNWMKCDGFARRFALRAEAPLNQQLKGKRKGL